MLEVLIAVFTQSQGGRLISTKGPMLYSASTEVATDPAPVMSASTPPTALPEVVATTQAPTGLSTSGVDSPMSM